jgi:hypothetical protein
MTQLLKNFSKARDGVIDLAKQVPSQLVHIGEQVQTFVKGIDLTDVRSLPRQIKAQADKLDLSVKLTVPQVFTDRVGQAKVFAPIDVEAIQARVGEVGEYLQTLPSKIQEVPGLVQEFVSDFPDSATKLASDTTAKARSIVEDLKARPIIFVPSRSKAAAKKAAKKPVAKKAKAGANGNGVAEPVQPTL